MKIKILIFLTGTIFLSNSVEAGLDKIIPSPRCSAFLGPDPSFECPEENKAYMHPNDCTLFYDCYNGTATLGECQCQYLFDTRYSGCNHPDQVDCGDRERPTDYPTKGTTTTTKKPEEPDFNCPEPEGFFADPENCRGFYQCHVNHPYHYLCQKNLVYNEKEEYCDYLHNVECGDRPILD